MENSVDYGKLGKRIKKYRCKADLTQEQLAGRIDVATSTVAHAESGTSKPSLPLLVKIANELGVSVDQLLCDSLPVVDEYLDKDIADLLDDCSVFEKEMIRDMIAATKGTLRKHREQKSL